jgi:hypothetical protein
MWLFDVNMYNSVLQEKWLSYILKQQCLSVWAVPGRFFQSLLVPTVVSVCLSVYGDKQGSNRLGGVCLCGQCLEDSSSHCSFQ